MDIYSVLQAGGNIKLEVTGADLLAFAKVLIDKSQEAKALEIQMAPSEDRMLTAKEAAALCHVCITTLWSWDKAGYLVPSKMGKRRYYKESDIKRLMNNRSSLSEQSQEHTSSL
jgi:hypothetical protein